MKNVLIFMAGLTLGAGVSWVYNKNKYEEMVKDEVESLREHAREKESNEKTTEETLDKDIECYKNDSANLEKVSKIINYNHYSSNDENEIPVCKKPYVVTPDDFASLPGFDTDSFHYYNNDIISNDNNEIVDDVEQILGLSILEVKDQFGIYEDDSVYIRNERLKCDYEVLLENEDYIRRNGD